MTVIGWASVQTNHDLYLMSCMQLAVYYPVNTITIYESSPARDP